MYYTYPLHNTAMHYTLMLSLLHMVLHIREWHSTYGTCITHMVTSITHAITHERIYYTCNLEGTAQ